MSETEKLVPVGQPRLVRAFARARKDGWPRCPKCGKRLRPYEGNMRDAGTSRPQQWQCDAHFIPSYWGDAPKLVGELNSPNSDYPEYISGNKPKNQKV